jgi:hypothetical protein
MAMFLSKYVPMNHFPMFFPCIEFLLQCQYHPNHFYVHTQVPQISFLFSHITLVWSENITDIPTLQKYVGVLQSGYESC